MKKIITLILSVFIGMLSFLFYAGAESFVYDEASFEIPDDTMTQQAHDYCDLCYTADDGSAEFRLSQVYYYDGASLISMDKQILLDYYTVNLCSFSDEFEGVNIQDWSMSRGCDGINIDGTLYTDDGEHFTDIYIFPTRTFLYVFEFAVYEDEGYYLIDEIIDSISVYDYTYADEEEGEDVSVFEIVCMLLIIIVCFTVVFIYKKIGREAFWAGVESKEAPSEKQIKPKLTKEKFELNGKSINGINERFTVGAKDDNFALKELERERREREKMFD